MKWSVPTMTFGSLATACLLMLGAGFAVLVAFNDSLDDAARLGDTRSRYAQLVRLQGLVHHIQESAATYLADPDPLFLSAFRLGVSQLDERIAGLRPDEVAAEEWQSELPALQRELQLGTGLLERAVASRERGGFEAARRVLDDNNQDPPFPLTVALKHGESLLARQEQRMANEENTLADEKRERVWTLAGAGAICLLIQGWVYALLRHELRHSTALQRDLRQINEHLNERVAERTRQLVQANAELSFLSQKVLQAQEQERRNLAFELHDEIGQAVAALLMNLRRLGSGDKADRRQATAATVGDCADIAQTIYSQLGDMALNLRPSVLDRLGLIPALQWYTRSQIKRSGCHIVLAAEPIDDQLPDAVLTAAFRIVQEAINNSLRHGGAQNIQVDVGCGQGLLHLAIRDDGKGFDMTAVARDVHPFAGFGLLGMRERATLAGGSVTVISRPGAGTTVLARFPVSRDAAIRHAADDPNRTFLCVAR